MRNTYIYISSRSTNFSSASSLQYSLSFRNSLSLGHTLDPDLSYSSYHKVSDRELNLELHLLSPCLWVLSFQCTISQSLGFFWRGIQKGSVLQGYSTSEEWKYI